MERNIIISVKDLSYFYDGNENLILEDINLDIRKGDFLALVGPNGGGKSTLIKLIMGILKNKNGEIKLFGKDIKKFNNWSCIGYISQKATNFDKRFPATVKEVVSMGRISRKGLLRSLDKKDEKIVEDCLEEVSMLKYKDYLLSSLSGGQAQRVLIARALASDPCLLVLDEPTVGIDQQNQQEFYKLLQKLRKDKGITIILVSHDIEAIAKEANTFACLNQKLIYHGEPKGFVNEKYFENLYGENFRLINHSH